MAEVSLRRSPSKTRERKERRLSRFARDLKVNRYLWLMILPVLAFYVIFCYVPMYGVVIAFKDFSPMKGILGSSWAGLKYFQEFLFPCLRLCQLVGKCRQHYLLIHISITIFCPCATLCGVALTLVNLFAAVKINNKKDSSRYIKSK